MKKKLQKLAILLCVAIASGMFFTPNNTSAFNSSLFTICWEPSSVEEKKGAGGAWVCDDPSGCSWTEGIEITGSATKECDGIIR